MEIWDLFNANRDPLYRTHIRGNKLKAGEYHVVVGIWVINANGKLLLTKRSLQKEQYPDLWENTYGSLLAGEINVDGALRELYEETGIRADKRDLQYCVTQKTSTSFVDMYILNSNILISKLVMQENETTEAKWVSIDQFKSMILDGQISPLVAKRYLLIHKKIDKVIFELRCKLSMQNLSYSLKVNK